MHGASQGIQLGMNFLISFFTPYITSAIDYRYGYIFAACCFMGAVVVYFFVCESQNRTLEEIDTMYILASIWLGASIGSRRRVRTCRVWITRTSRLVLEVSRRMKPARLQRRDARVRGRRVAVFSKLLGRDSKVVIELLDATTFTSHAEAAGPVTFLAYIGVVSLPVIPCTRLCLPVSFPWDIRLEQGHRVSKKISRNNPH